MIKNSLKDVVLPSKIDVDGSGLSILICTSYNFYSNWMAFSNWYSLNKYLPGAKVAITCSRSSSVDNYLYHWVYKCGDLRYCLHKNVGDSNKLYGVYLALKRNLVKQPLIVLDADMVAVRELSSEVVKTFGNVNFVSKNGVLFFNNVDLEKIVRSINTHIPLEKELENTVIGDLGGNATENEIVTFVSYKNVCGNFTKTEWEKGKKAPPFNVAYALQSSNISLNERRVLSLWGEMASFWEMVNQI